jgi:D-glycero-alpha-D-manno-heptose-7-phosphate kinase
MNRPASPFQSLQRARQIGAEGLPSVHSRAPLRLGLAGGGTDVAPYSEIFGGQVLNATISLFTHCHLAASAGGVRMAADDFDEALELPLAEYYDLSGPLLLHKAVYNRIVREFHGGRPLPVNMSTYSDAPPGSGVGSSSALVVAMVQAFRELLQLPLGEYDVAHLAYEIERVDCAMAGGKQDQYAATFGGFNFIEFEANDRVIVNPLRLRWDRVNELESRLILYFTGRSRESARIIESQIAATKAPAGDAIEAMHRIKQGAQEMKEALLKGQVSRVLDILGASWHVKKRAAAGISNSHIDEIADAAMAAGSRGLKISGAGGGGFMMIAVDPETRYAVLRALTPFGGRVFPFNFVVQGAQSWIIT